MARYNDLDSVKALFEENPGQIAALIVEPVGANMGVVPPKEGFLEGLRRLCTQHGALLIFDEVITGFRLAPGGAQEYFGVSADLVTYGKIIGGGMPVGAYGGSRELMRCVAPTGKVYQAGTLSGNPVAMAAGLATLSELREHPEIYSHIKDLAASLAQGHPGKQRLHRQSAGLAALRFLHFPAGGGLRKRQGKRYRRLRPVFPPYAGQRDLSGPRPV